MMPLTFPKDGLMEILMGVKEGSDFGIIIICTYIQLLTLCASYAAETIPLLYVHRISLLLGQGAFFYQVSKDVLTC